MISKWLQVVCLSLATAAMSFATFVNYDSNRRLDKFGKVATVDSVVSVVKEITTKKKRITGVETTSEAFLGTMRYTNDKNQKITFKRYLNEEYRAKIQRGEPLYVRYILGEHNSEEFAEPSSRTVWLLLASLAFLGGLIYVIRKR